MRHSVVLDVSMGWVFWCRPLKCDIV